MQRSWYHGAQGLFPLPKELYWPPPRLETSAVLSMVLLNAEKSPNVANDPRLQPCLARMW